MSFAIDLSEYGPDLSKKYETVISSDPEITWAVFGYDGSGNALKPVDSGSGDLDEFVEAFDDAQIQYGIVRVEFNGVNKIVLVGYVGDNVSGRKRLVFNSHMAAVAKQFSGHHIQITALSADELTPKIIMDRVNAAAGSKYVGSTQKAPSTKPRYIKADGPANEEDWGETKPVEDRELTHGPSGSYTSSAREELQSFRKGGLPKEKKREEPVSNGRQITEDDEEEDEEEDEKEQSGISGLNSGTSYKPVGKIDLKAIRAEAKNSKFADARIEKIEPAYKPVGKVDLKAIREQARKEKQLKAEREAKTSFSAKDADEKDDEPVLPKKSSFPSRAEVKEPKSKSSAKSEFTSETTGSEYSAPDRRAEYGVKSHASKSKPASSLGDEDEPHYTSLSERMKAFQNSVSSAKPQFDNTSLPKRPSSERASATRARPAATPASQPSQKTQDSDEEEDAPISVAAQLAKSRLSSQSEDSTEQDEIQKARQASYGIKSGRKQESLPKDDDEDEDTPKASVSTFAARFANKKEPKEDEEDAPPAPARRVPEPESAPLPPRKAAAPVEAEPEKEEEEEEVLTAVVIQKYTKDDDDEINLTLDETITHIQKVDDNWWIGKNSANEVGLFPAEYVRASDAAQSGNDEDKDDAEKVAIALYAHEPEEGEQDELAFAENEKVVVLDFTSDDWWTGRNTKGQVGLFPSSYVKLE